jgi:hypothetical protein
MTGFASEANQGLPLSKDGQPEAEVDGLNQGYPITYNSPQRKLHPPASDAHNRIYERSWRNDGSIGRLKKPDEMLDGLE